MKPEDLFKDLVWDNLVKAAMTKMFVAVPFLAWGPIGGIIEHLFIKFAGKLYDVLKLELDVKSMVFKNKRLEKEFNRASVKLKIIARDKGINSEEFKKQRDLHKKQLADFVRFNI